MISVCLLWSSFQTISYFSPLTEDPTPKKLEFRLKKSGFTPKTSVCFLWSFFQGFSDIPPFIEVQSPKKSEFTPLDLPVFEALVFQGYLQVSRSKARSGIKIHWGCSPQLRKTGNFSYSVSISFSILKLIIPDSSLRSVRGSSGES